MLAGKHGETTLPLRLTLSASAARAAVDADEVRERRDQAQHPAYAKKGKEKREKERDLSRRPHGEAAEETAIDRYLRPIMRSQPSRTASFTCFQVVGASPRCS